MAEYEMKTLKRATSDSEIDESIWKKKKPKYPNFKEYTEVNDTKTTINTHLYVQLEKLLKDFEIKNKYKKKLTLWIEEFQTFLNTLPIHNEIYISNFSRKASKRPSRDMKFVKNLTSRSRNNLCCDKDIKITLIRPESVGTFGLYKIDALPGPHIEINLHMTIPKRCFKDNDFLNNRYFVKKFYYLMYLAEHLHSQNICSSIKCAYYYENVLLPFLMLCPNSTDKIIIKIFLIPEHNNIEIIRFSPQTNNVNSQVFEEAIGYINNIGVFGTTLYNTALAFDVSLAENNVFIEQIFSNAINIQKGLKLIVLWMNQREFDIGLGSFSKDLAIYILVYLISRGIVYKNMTPLQVFRSFVYFMYTMDLTQVPISICENISQEQLQIYKNSFDIVIMDKTGTYNTAAFLHNNAYLQMKNNSKLALDILDRHDLFSFSDLFLVHIPFYLQYDVIIDVKYDNNYGTLLKTVENEEKVKYCGHHIILIIKILQVYLENSFGEKLANIVPIVLGSNDWHYGVRHKISHCRILFGIQLNAEKDPVSNSDIKTRLNDFWNKLLPYRSLNESNKTRRVSNSGTIKDRRDIIKNIANDVLNKNLNLQFKFFYNELEDFLMNKNVDTWYASGTNEETTLKIIQSSVDLERKIRTLNISPKIITIRNISDVFCFANVFPPIPSSYKCDKRIFNLKENNVALKYERLKSVPRYIEPIECVIQLDKIGKPPYNLEKIQQMKTIFLLKISELLLKQYNIVSSKKTQYLDILYEGIVFRYYLLISKEIFLLKKHSEKNKEICLQMEKKFMVVPKIVEALQRLNVKYPSYGVSTCLAKRWIRAQLIDDFLLPDMVINLLNAHQFLHQLFHNAPVAPQAAFLRLLNFFVEMKWDLQPVVINFDNNISDEQIYRLQFEMQKNREKFPVLVILTPFDDSYSIFTKNSPCIEILNRMKVLAREFLNYFRNMVLKESLYSLKELLIPNRKGFHCILNLKSSLNPRIHNQITRSGVNYKKIYTKPRRNDQYMPVTSFDPVQIYLAELRNTYGDFCVFFHDTYGGNYIVVLWKPDVIQFREDIRKGFEILGKDILHSVEY